MMGIVPTFAEGQDAENGIIPARIAAAEGPTAPHVTGRIDAPSDVVNQAHTNQSAPDETVQRSHPGHRNQAADDGRNEQAQSDPQRKELAGEHQRFAGANVLGVAVEFRRFGVEEPADVCVPGSFENAPDAFAAVQGRMRIVGRVAELVMPTMKRDPLLERPLDGHRAEDRPDKLDPGIGLERAMHEETVKSDRDAEHGDDIHAEH